MNQEKIRASILASIQKESDRDLYNESLQNSEPRTQLTERIRAIRDEGIQEIKIGCQEEIERRFFEKRTVLKPRHQRDIKRITSLIKCFALFNLWWRDRDGSTITANQDDIAEAFSVWERIGVSQELNLPPYIYNLYTEVILAAWQEKACVGRKGGLTRNDIAKKYYEVFEQMLDVTKFRQQILPMLETAGLIYQEADLHNKRKVLIFPNPAHAGIVQNNIVRAGVG